MDRKLYNERTFQVRVENVLSDCFSLENGTPQGSIISPILFLIMINDLTVDEQKAFLSLFADDSAVFKSGKNIKSLMKDIQNSLNKIADWCHRWGFKISESKTVAVLFSNKNLNDAHYVLKINNKPIKIEKVVKFLGMNFDSKLNWDHHITNIVTRCNKKINLIRSISGNRWGANKKNVLTIYKALIRPILDYGCEAFDSASKNILNKLNTIQYNCLKLACGAMTGTSLLALQNECGELPLELRRRKLQLQYAIKIKNSENHPAESIITDHWTNYYGKFNAGQETFFTKTYNIISNMNLAVAVREENKSPPWTQQQLIAPTCIFPSKFINNTDQIKFSEIFHSLHEEYFQIYTDGSGSANGRRAASFYVADSNIESACRLTDNLSILSTELIAIKLAILWLNAFEVKYKENYRKRKCAIFTDCKNAKKLLDINFKKSTHSVAGDIIEIIKKIHFITIEIIWLPGHIGIIGNEIADSIAKSALGKQQIEEHCVLNLEDSFIIIANNITDMWQKSYTNNKTSTHYKNIEPLVSEKEKFSDKLRKKEVTISRLRLGKAKLNGYLYTMGIHQNGWCDSCKTEETIEHFILNCKESKICTVVKGMREGEQVSIRELLNQKDNIEKIYRSITRDI